MPEQLALEKTITPDRRQFVGSSDIAAIIGLSPFRTAYEVFEEKTAPTWEEEDSPILRRGRRAEPFLLETLKDEFDVWVDQANVIFEHPKFPFLRCQCDFTYHVDDERLGHGEIKSVGFNRGEWGEAGSQEVPAYYVAQVMFGMQVNGLSESTIWGCFGFDDIRPYRFEFDPEAGQALEDAAVNFWHNHVVPRVPPASQTAEDSQKILARFKGFTWEASDEALAIAERLRAIKRSIALLEAEKKAREKQFFDCLVSAAEIHGIGEGDSKNFTILRPGGEKLATWNLQHRKGYTVSETDFRVLRFAGGKDKE